MPADKALEDTLLGIATGDCFWVFLLSISSQYCCWVLAPDCPANDRTTPVAAKAALLQLANWSHFRRTVKSKQPIEPQDRAARLKRIEALQRKQWKVFTTESFTTESSDKFARSKNEIKLQSHFIWFYLIYQLDHKWRSIVELRIWFGQTMPSARRL